MASYPVLSKGLFRLCRCPANRTAVGAKLIAQPGRQATLTYWVRSLIGGLAQDPPDRVDNIYAPAVVAVSSAGEKYVLQHTGTYRQARAACRRLAAELRQQGDATFCQRYGVPGRFAD